MLGMVNRAPRTVLSILAVPLITIFVRHSANCPHVDDHFYKRCQCRKSLRYFHDGKQRTVSAKTRSWALAEEAKRKLEGIFRSADTANPVGTVTVEGEGKATIERAVELFLSDKRSQGLDSEVLKKYERELGRFSDFMKRRSRYFPSEIRLEDLTEFRAGWDAQYPSSTTRGKVQERLRAFLRYCYESQLIDRVPRLSPIRVDEVPTLPLSAAQYQKLLNAVANEFPGKKGTRVHALIRLMRFSGLAIRDAVTLERDELTRDVKHGLYRIVTNRQKTGTHVSVPIPPDVADEVKAAMLLNDSERYIFWNTGTGKPQTAVTNWQHDLRRVFRAAGQPEGHPHQLRDTFAVGLLEKGVPLEEVSKLLGHESIKTTERYYAKWVKERQDRLDALVVATWETAPNNVSRPEA
ncbi:site-specific integrase [Edaphobacter sp. DSM 109919]|uniref:Site-specific integrase n=1 Tax=Edaphobacter paludis TaxID=3035702 RepID=A0AAU7CVG7_9BACT